MYFIIIFSFIIAGNNHKYNIYNFCCTKIKTILLGSKDLGFYVFRTLICIVGKP